MHEQPPTGSLGQRKHRFVQSEISQTALKLFADKGFERTTVDEIAESAGISRRTFFRYFETKEDVVVTSLAASGEFLVEIIGRQPADFDPLTALRLSVREFVSHYQRTDPQAWRVLHVIQSTPKLRARFLFERDRWLARITEVLAMRSVPMGKAETAAATALSILTVVYDRWHANQTLDVARAVDDVFQELESLTRSAADGP